MTPNIVPIGRPKMKRDELTVLMSKHNLVSQIWGVALVGLRGYYWDSMGYKGTNDRGIYDDAMFVISPNVFASFNANTDPSITRKGVATLVPGLWKYQKGRHRGLYQAFRQAQPVTVARDGQGLDDGWFGINIHKGSRNNTSSLGCQTIYPDQWEGFRALVYSEMDRYAQETVDYLLVEQRG